MIKISNRKCMFVFYVENIHCKLIFKHVKNVFNDHKKVTTLTIVEF